MTYEKFEKDARMVHKFIQIYCDDKHKEKPKTDGLIKLQYRGEYLGDLKYRLCEECEKTLLYSYERLLECPHEEKPRCRKCPNPCYEKSEWKKLAKIMKYSGMKMGILKIRKLFKGKKKEE